MRCAILLCLLYVFTSPVAAAELFSIWPGHPRAPTLPGSEDGRISRQWAVEVDLRGIVADRAAIAHIDVRLPEGVTRFAMRHVDLVAGFVLHGEDDFRIDPEARDSDISYTWYGESGDRQLSIAVYHGTMSATQTGPGGTYLRLKHALAVHPSARESGACPDSLPTHRSLA